jgi:uncharacterized protein YbjT (DUF2867 family)
MVPDVALVVGATGLLGMEIVALLRQEQMPVRAVVRPSADAKKRAFLEGVGATIVDADLKRRASLVAACEGVSTVFSTASSTRSRQPGDSIATVDEEGQLALVDAARKNGVERFVFVSFPPSDVDYALQRAKRRVEDAVRKSGMAFTILQPAKFIEVWLGAAMGFDPARGRARILGRGDGLVSWISFRDVARCVVAGARMATRSGKVIALGGPDALSPLEVVKIFEDLGGPKVALEYVPESELEARLAAAVDPMQEAYAATMIGAVRGQVVDSTLALELCSVRMTRVQEYAVESLRMAS